MSEKPNITSAEKKLRIKEAVIIITEHAMQRFIERWLPMDEWDNKPDNMEEWAQKMESVARSSTEITLNPGMKLRRMLNNGVEEARYFYNKNYHLTFVVSEQDGKMTIVTVEKPDYIKDKSGQHLRSESDSDNF